MSQSEELDTLAYEFFCTFSRFEYALKASGYLMQKTEAKPDWSRFARISKVEQFIENPSSNELNKAVDYIFEKPPMKQCVESQRLKWKESLPNGKSKADNLFKYIRRVRNNLFHGGKFNNGWFNPDRNKDLLRHSLTILKESVEVVPEVARAFHYGNDL